MTVIGPNLPAEAPYPAAPWHLNGHVWAGVFRADQPLDLPRGLEPLLPRSLVAVMLVRYLEGTLRYDELVVGSIVRCGLRPGLYVHNMWVDDVASLWGGRRIWGVPKDLAAFKWSGDLLRVTDEAGVIAVLTLDRHENGSPAVPALAPGLGRIGENWAYTVARVSGRPGSPGMCVCEWSRRFPYRLLDTRPRIGFSAKPFRMIFPAPNLLPG